MRFGKWWCGVVGWVGVGIMRQDGDYDVEGCELGIC